MMKEIKLKISEIYSQVRRISSFEGREAVTASGDSDYERIRVTDQDSTLITDYALAGLRVTMGLLDDRIIRHSVKTLEGGDVEVTIQLQCNSQRVDQDSLSAQISELVVSYIMKQWLTERKPARIEFYTSQYTDLLGAAQDMLYQQDVPVKKRRPTRTYHSEVEVENEEPVATEVTIEQDDTIGG